MNQRSLQMSVLFALPFAAFLSLTDLTSALGKTPSWLGSSHQAEPQASCSVSPQAIATLLGSLEVQSGAEWQSIQDVIVHTPGDEVFVGVLHPDAALYDRPFSIEGAQKEHQKFICLMQQNGARVFRLVDILLAGTVNEFGESLPGPHLDQLRLFAARFLTYETSGLPEAQRSEQEAYKTKVLQSLPPQDLVKIILQQPTIKLASTDGHNTGFAATYQMNPVMNMYFMRDQVISTAKGLVIGRFNAVQRDVETSIATFAYGKLGIKPIYTISGEGRLEGGDFLPAGDTAFLGQGLRTNRAAAQQLLQAGAFGTQRVVLVNDSWQNQEQMHLDTYFNIAGEKTAILVEDRMDIRDQMGHIVRPADPRKRLTVDVYQFKNGQYSLVLVGGDFQAYMEKTLGFTLIPIAPADQLKYGVNFLSLRDHKILGIDGVSQIYKDRLLGAGIDATWMDFHNLIGGYGAAHCTSQVIRRK